MATFRAIETISRVLVRLLEASHAEADVKDARFERYQSGDFRSGGRNGGTAVVTLYLYRTQVNGTTRTPPGRRLPSGETQRTQLPLDLYYLITIWAEDPSTQHQLVGWVMRTLETTPILPEGVLNGMNKEVFRPDETVEITPNDLSNEELFRIWDLLDESYRLSIPYLVRNVRIEAEETVPAEGVVERRIFDYLQHGAENGDGGARGG